MFSRAPKVPPLLTDVQLEEIFNWALANQSADITQIQATFENDTSKQKAASLMLKFLTDVSFQEVRRLCNDAQLRDIVKAHATAPFKDAAEAKNYLQHHGTISRKYGSSGTLKVDDPIDVVLRFVDGPHCKTYSDIANRYPDEEDAEDKRMATYLFQALKDTQPPFGFFNEFRTDPNARIIVAKRHVEKAFTNAEEIRQYLKATGNLKQKAVGRGSEFLSFSPKTTPDQEQTFRDLLDEIEAEDAAAEQQAAASTAKLTTSALKADFG